MRNLSRTLLFLCFAVPLTAQKPAEPVSPSSVINKYLPSWIRVGGEDRARFEGYSGLGFAPHQSDAYWLSRTRLFVALTPVSWLHLYGEGQDARAIGKQPGQPPFENVWDVHQAFVELGQLNKSRFAIRAGRQEIAIADNRVIGAIPWTNANRTFDAVRASFTFSGNRIEAMAASVVVNVNDTWDHHQQGNNIHGIFSEFPRIIPYVNLQPYVLWRVQRNVRNEAGVLAKVDEKIPGILLGGKLPLDFDYKVEMLRQFGSIGSDEIRAWMGHWELGRTWRKAPFSPHFWGEYNYFSGDKNAKDGIHQSYDPLYPTVHDKYGFADQIAGRNLKHIRGGVEAKLPHGIGATLEMNDWHLATPFDGLYNSSSVIARSATGTAGTHVGGEIDLITTWKMKGPVQAGTGIGYIIPGEFLKRTTPGKHYIYPYIFFTYKL